MGITLGTPWTGLLRRHAQLLSAAGVDVRFKWADNTPGDPGDILDFYRHGDAAPDGRFLYRYFE